MPNNEKQWSSATPGLLIFLVDQSGSMTLPYDQNDSRTVFTARVINRVINEIIQKNYNGDKPKNRCFISVIGYNDKIVELASGFLEDLDNAIIRIEKVKKKISDGAGGLIDIDIDMPIWIDPVTEDRWTNMKDAFVMAKDLAERWMNDKPENPAPVIINISDGMPYYGKDQHVCQQETQNVVNEIMQLKNDDGNVLVFNAEIGSNKNMIVLPNSIDEVKPAGEEAEFLYNISSTIPEGYIKAAEKNGLTLKDGSKGCVFAADAEHLIKLIDFGSSKGKTDK